MNHRFPALETEQQLARWFNISARSYSDGGLDQATCASIRQHTWTLFTQGQAATAVEILQELLARLKQERLADDSEPTREQALTLLYLGRIYDHAGRPDLALGPLQQAMESFKQLGDNQQGNLAATLSDLANAHTDLGQLEAAQALIEQALVIARRLGLTREIAAGLVQIAYILMEQQRYGEADARYHEALLAAQQAGDRALEGIALQYLGILQYNLGNYDRAVQLYQETMRLFLEAGDLDGEMFTSNQLGTAEKERGNLDAAQVWYVRSRELAVQLKDQRQLGAIVQNLGILYQARAEQEHDMTQRAAWLRQALGSVQESLQVWQETMNQVNAAASFYQLGVLYHMLGDLVQAEAHLEQARAIHELLNHPNLFTVYGELAQVAHLRGDVGAAAQWQIKREAKEAELVRRRGTGGQMPALVDFEPLLRAIATIAQGDATQRAEIEALLPQLEQKGWRIADATRRLWAGEPDLAALASGIDVRSLALVARILQFVADPDTPPLLPEQAPPAPAPEAVLAALPASIRAAIQQRDQAALQRAFEALDPDEQQAVAAALQALQPQHEAAGGQAARALQQAEPLLQAIVEVARGNTDQQLAIEEALAKMEQQGFQLRDPVRRIWAGERDATALTAGLDGTDSALIGRVLDVLRE